MLNKKKWKIAHCRVGHDHKSRNWLSWGMVLIRDRFSQLESRGMYEDYFGEFIELIEQRGFACGLGLAKEDICLWWYG